MYASPASSSVREKRREGVPLWTDNRAWGERVEEDEVEETDDVSADLLLPLLLPPPLLLLPPHGLLPLLGQAPGMYS